MYTFLPLPHSKSFCQTHCISSSWNNLHRLIFRSNQFSQKIDSCWYGSDCIHNEIPVSKLYSVPTTQDVIRVCQITSVPTITIDIRVGKNISPFQLLPKVIRVGLSLLRSNRRRAILVGFSSKCYPTIPASRLGSSRLDHFLELALILHSISLSIFLKQFLYFSITLQNFLIYHKHNTFIIIPGIDTDTKSQTER